MITNTTAPYTFVYSKYLMCIHLSFAKNKILLRDSQLYTIAYYTFFKVLDTTVVLSVFWCWSSFVVCIIANYRAQQYKTIDTECVTNDTFQLIFSHMDRHGCVGTIYICVYRH